MFTSKHPILSILLITLVLFVVAIITLIILKGACVEVVILGVLWGINLLFLGLGSAWGML